MSVRYTSNMAGYNSILPQYTTANKVSRQLRHSLRFQTKSCVEGCTTQCSLFPSVMFKKMVPPPNSMVYNRTVMHTSTYFCLCLTLGMGGVGEEGEKSG